jgi:hypothetical protein
MVERRRKIGQWPDSGNHSQFAVVDIITGGDFMQQYTDDRLGGDW